MRRVALSVLTTGLLALAPTAVQAAPAQARHIHPAPFAAPAPQPHHPHGAAAAGTPPPSLTRPSQDAGATAGTRSAGNLVGAAAAAATLPRVGGAWSPIGPNAISANGQTNTGRVLALARSGPTVYLASAGGGIWKSFDSGANWIPTSDSTPTLAVNSLAIDPANASVLYAGTGEAANPVDGFQGVGIYKSSDAGANWTVAGNSPSLLNGYDVSQVVVDPTNSSRVFAAVVRWVAPSTGVAISNDGGTSWAYPAANALSNHDVTDLAIASNGDLYAAVGDSGGGASNGIYLSVDHGLTWVRSAGLPAPAGTYRWKLALAPSTAGNPAASRVLYAVAGDQSSGAVQKVYKTTNGGLTWTDVTGVGSTSIFDMDRSGGTGQAWYDLVLAVDPLSTSTVYVATTDIFKMTDGAGTWTDLTNAYGGPCSPLPACLSGYPGIGPSGFTTAANIHPDQHAILLFNSSRILVGNDGGIYSSADAGASFTASQGGLALSQFYGGAATASGQTIFGGLQDNGNVLTTDGGATWSDRTGGDGFYTAIDPSNPQNVFSENGGGVIEVSRDGGVTFPPFTNWVNPSNGTDRALFAAPLTLDPNQPAIVYSGRQHLWRSASAPGYAAGSWTQMTVTGLSMAQAMIRWIAIAPTDSNTIYVADSTGHTFKTSNAGLGAAATWSPADGTAPDCTGTANVSPYLCPGINSYVDSIAVDPTNAAVLYETVNGFSGGSGQHVYRSGNGGVQWADISLGLPNVPFRSIVIDPADSNRLYVGSDLGVYTSANGGGAWSLLGTGLPNASVAALLLRGTTLIALTHGRSAWKVGTSTALPPAPPTGLAATPAGYFANDLVWNASTGATSYSVRRSTFSGGGYTLLAAGIAGTTFKDLGARPGVSHYYVVTASNGSESTFSNEAVGTPSALVESVVTQIQNKSYHLDTPNDGGFSSWVEIDAALRATVPVTSSGIAIATANIDLWTVQAGFNQDIGIFMQDSANPGLGDQLMAWKESGGFAGTYSPNAAFVQSLVPVVAGNTYTFKLKWKPNKAAAGMTIFAGAGTQLTQFSPTRLTVRLVPASVVFSSVQKRSYHLDTPDDGGFGSWMSLDASLDVSVAGADTSVQVTANMDLWTAQAGYNQDIGIFVSDNGGPDTLIAWKESGGFAGTYSPNAAFVSTTFVTRPGHNYTFRLKWKPNRTAPGGTLFGAGGTAGTEFSPTRLTVEQMAPGAFAFNAQAQSYHLDSSNNGSFTSWVELDPAGRLATQPPADTMAVATGNVDLWTSTATYNQDIGIFSCDAGASDCSQFGNYTLLAWKESGGFAGTFSPNAATVQTLLALTAGHRYSFTLAWKPNKASPGGVLYGGAGTASTVFSPTSLLVQFAG